MNMAYQALEDAVVVVYGPRAPTQAEWDAWLRDFETLVIERRRPMYVVSLGGGPDGLQRGEMNRLATWKPRMAVLTESTLARAIAAAFAGGGRVDVRCFLPDERHDSVRFLGLAPDRVLELNRVAWQLERRLSASDETATDKTPSEAQV
jgi:hypothetical protein